MDLASTLRWAAERHPGRPAVRGTGRHLGYREWDARTNRLARALAATGVGAGDRVAFALSGGEPLASLHLAAQKLGAVSVPLSTRFSPDELRYCLDDAAARLLVVDAANAERAAAATDGGTTPVRDAVEIDDRAGRESDRDLPGGPAETDLSVMLYTSGTTGRPKGVPRTHRAEHSAAVAHAVQTQQRDGEVVLGVMPMFHTMGLRTLLASIVVGGTWVGQAAFDAEEALGLIRSEGVSSLYLVPTIYWSLLRTGGLHEARTLERLAYAGAAMTPSLAEELVAEVGPGAFVNHFGSTEIYTFTIGPDVAAKPGSAGRAGIFSRVRLVAPEAGASPDDVVAPGEQGQVIVSMASPEAFTGYWQRPDANDKSIRGGWYYTGDLAVADDDGDLWVAGRVDDMINSGGENVYPDEIEAALIRCPAVDDVCVVGLPHERWGHAVTAFVVPVPGTDPVAAAERTLAFARDALPSLKQPKRVIAVDAVPRSGVGKTLRRTLVAGEFEALADIEKGATVPEATHRSPARIEDGPLVTGQGRFLDDLDPLPGTLVAAVVRSTQPHARLRGVDLSRARAHPGVAAVIGPDEVLAALRAFPLSTGAAMPYYPTGTDKVRFVGEPVAVVVATDRHTAEDAAELVAVDYEPLDAVVDTRTALAPDAPLLHDGAGSNVATDRTFTFGAVDEAFAGAAHVVEGEYDFPRYSSVPMECYSVIADWRDGADGPSVETWANFHGPFTMVPVMAAALGLPTSRVRLHVPADIGGSFGIKAGIYPYVVLMALASRHSGTPVRWTEDRIEHLLASSSGADRRMRFAAAVAADGEVLALQADLVDNVGAYLRPPEPSTLYRCFGNITGPYRIGAVRIRARAVVTNQMPVGLNRGFGGQQLYFGLERLMDAVAGAAGLDVVEVRRRNLVGAFPHETPTGGVYDSGDYAAAVDLAVRNADLDGLRARRDEVRAAGGYYGIGVALVVDPSGTNIGYVGLATPSEQRKPGRDKSGSTEHVRVSVDMQGVVTVLLGSVPQGQGHATVARQVAADRLGLPVEQVRVVVDMDTATTPWTVTSGSYSSRFAPLVTSAVVQAADRIAETVRAAGSVLLGVAPEDLELADGTVRHRSDPDRAVQFRHASGVVHWDPGALPEGTPARLYEEAAFTPREVRAATADDRINSSLCYGFVAEIVAVAIDPDTLEIRLDRVSSVHDAGTVLNQQLLDGQVYGALAHAIGGAMYEEFSYAPSGQPTSATFLDYLCPTSAETDYDLRTDHVVSPSPLTPLGAKGCGEGSSMSFPVAFANAVADALRPAGVEITRLPLHGDVLHQLLENTESTKNTATTATTTKETTPWH